MCDITETIEIKLNQVIISTPLMLVKTFH